MQKKGVNPIHQSCLFQQLKVLRADRRGPGFVQQQIANFVNTWIEKEPQFVKYFVDNYANRQEQWAVCYRDKGIPDTTAHIEAFHNLLKRVYSNKRNRYMRTLLEKLMQIEEDFFIKYSG